MKAFNTNIGTFLTLTGVASLGLSTLAGNSASAATLVSNLSNSVDVTTDYAASYFPEFSTEIRVGQSFTTGPLGATLNSIDLNFDLGFPGSPAIVSLYSDDALNPGQRPDSQLHVLSGAAIPELDQTYTYTSSGYSLAPLTTYWVVLAATTSGTVDTLYFLDTTTDTSESSAYGATIGNGVSAYSSVEGRWLTVSELEPGNTPVMLSVSATLVPEPASLGLLGVVSLIAMRRRRGK